MGTTKTLTETGLECYKKIIHKKNFEYLQNFRINYYHQNYKINWLPYEFQATWSYEMAVYYPFLFLKKNNKIFNECVLATLSRVDFLHFAGSWPENSFFYKLRFSNKGDMHTYYNNINNYIKKIIKPKSYGRIKYKIKS